MYFKLHQTIRKTKMTSTEKAVMYTLATYANDYWEAWPSIESIAREASCTDRTVERALKRLSEIGLIFRYDSKKHPEIKTQKPKHIKSLTTIFFPKENPSFQNLPTCKPSLQVQETDKNPTIRENRIVQSGDATVRESQIVQEEAPQKSVKKLTSSPKKSKKTDPSEEDFKEIWAIYPRKVGKSAGLKAYQKAHKKYGKEKILKALIASKKYFSDDPQYIPHFSTWLNKERYLDEPEAQTVVAVASKEKAWLDLWERDKANDFRKPYTVGMDFEQAKERVFEWYKENASPAVWKEIERKEF